jgi:hypothetical protein
VQNRVIGVIGAVETGVGLWYFTNGHWGGGVFYMAGVAFLVSLYLRRERRMKGGGGRRY